MQGQQPDWNSRALNKSSVHGMIAHATVLGDSIVTDVTISKTYSPAADKFINTDP